MGIFLFMLMWNGGEWNRGVEETKGEVESQFRLKRFLVNPRIVPLKTEIYTNRITSENKYMIA